MVPVEVLALTLLMVFAILSTLEFQAPRAKLAIKHLRQSYKTNIGLFDVEGGAATRPTRQITSPLFDRVTIRLNENYFSGKQFVITTHNYYVSI